MEPLPSLGLGGFSSKISLTYFLWAEGRRPGRGRDDRRKSQRRERLARKDDVARDEPLKTDRQPSDRTHEHPRASEGMTRATGSLRPARGMPQRCLQDSFGDLVSPTGFCGDYVSKLTSSQDSPLINHSKARRRSTMTSPGTFPGVGLFWV